MIGQNFPTKKGPGTKAKVAQTYPKKPQADGGMAKSYYNGKPRQKHSNTNINSGFLSVENPRRVSVSEDGFYKFKDIAGNCMANQLVSKQLDAPKAQKGFSTRIPTATGRTPITSTFTRIISSQGRTKREIETDASHFISKDIAEDFAIYKQLKANRNRAQGYASDGTDEDFWDAQRNVRLMEGRKPTRTVTLRNCLASLRASANGATEWSVFALT